MEGLTISDAAERSGFAPSALRFYEDAGLIGPARTPSGYRSYSDDDLERLAFVGRAKGFGLTLEEIAELLDLLDEDRCQPVQERLHALVDVKIAQARATIAELTGFVAELHRLVAGFDLHTPDGACDDRCGCRADAVTGEPDGAGSRSAPVELSAGPGSPPIACTLAPGDVAGRIADWHDLLAAAEVVETEAGLHIRFSEGTDPMPIAALAAAEQGCCAFFTFVLTIEATGVELDITAPDGAAPLIRSLVGVSA